MPVVASVIGTEPLRQFLTAPAKVCILASFTVGQLPKVVPALVRAGKTVFVNVDSSPGLAQDRGALDYIKSLGTHGVVSTRLSLIEKGRPLGLLTMMKVFVTDRSNLRRSTDAISRGAPDLVEIMPAPIVARMSAQAQRAMSPRSRRASWRRPRTWRSRWPSGPSRPPRPTPASGTCAANSYRRSRPPH
ncbi:hypothetical protein SANT12839_020550 [Streptomyces antimycoticus]|uniref:Glycerol-3-phosphate responsive antiterminator GlpP n=1 Tax=Streptomyces antimycoticus TaxID=68175 RepID=A0A4D4K5I1_9ACTN|nr:hypothetical protein SANT12839_020550 [Streptomyces antimycoticus]